MATGIITGYARGPKAQYPRIVLVKLTDLSVKPDSFIGKTIIVSDKHGNIYKGKITRVHSRRQGVVEAKFRRNIPGQLIGAIARIE